MIYDLVIVGGGVAAASALCSLRESSLAICVVSPQMERGDRIGEMLPGAANAILRQLGAWDDFLNGGHREAHGFFSAWGSNRLEERSSMMSVAEPGWHLDRPRFESDLWIAANRTNATHLPHKLSQISRSEPNWSLRLSNGECVEARFVLDCSGRSAVVARQFSSRVKEDQLVAAFSFLVQNQKEVEPTPGILTESAVDGWWYSSLLPDGRLVVAYFTDADLLPKRLTANLSAWDRLIEQTVFTNRRIQSAGYTADAVPAITNSSTAYCQPVFGKQWCAAGDAALSLDPLSSHGMTTALWSGRRAALAIDAFLAGDSEPLEQYAEGMDFGLKRYLSEKRSVYSSEQRFAERPFWSRRHQSMLPQG